MSLEELCVRLRIDVSLRHGIGPPRTFALAVLQNLSLLSAASGRRIRIHRRRSGRRDGGCTYVVSADPSGAHGRGTGAHHQRGPRLQPIAVSWTQISDRAETLLTPPPSAWRSVYGIARSWVPVPSGAREPPRPWSLSSRAAVACLERVERKDGVWASPETLHDIGGSPVRGDAQLVGLCSPAPRASIGARQGEGAACPQGRARRETG